MFSFTGEVVDDVQRTKVAAIGQRIRGEVHRPPFEVTVVNSNVRDQVLLQWLEAGIFPRRRVCAKTSQLPSIHRPCVELAESQ